MTEASKILSLEPHGADAFAGESPLYEWGRIYGGLVIAQSVCAAMKTIDTEGHNIHSLHAYFIWVATRTNQFATRLIVFETAEASPPDELLLDKVGERYSTSPVHFNAMKKGQISLLQRFPKV